jgi:hypothetical protein
MGYDIRADYNQQRLFSWRLEGWVGAKHSACFVRDIIDSHDFHNSKFINNAKKNVFICPKETELRFECVKKNTSKKHDVRLYRSKHGKNCTVVGKCTDERRGMRIEKEPHYDVLRLQINKQKDPLT